MGQLNFGGIPIGGLPTSSWPTYSIPGGTGSSGVRRLALSRIQEERARPAFFMRQVNAFSSQPWKRKERRLKLGKQIKELERRIRGSTNRSVVIAARRRIRNFRKELEEMEEE